VPWSALAHSATSCRYASLAHDHVTRELGRARLAEHAAEPVRVGAEHRLLCLVAQVAASLRSSSRSARNSRAGKDRPGGRREGFEGFFVPERVQEPDRLIEAVLGLRRA